MKIQIIKPAAEPYGMMSTEKQKFFKHLNKMQNKSAKTCEREKKRERERRKESEREARE